MASTSQEPPIFVVGFQRSGTTLLQGMLGAHRRIAAPPETYFVHRIFGLRDYFGDLSVDENLVRAAHQLLDSPVLADCGFDERRLVQRVAAGDRTYAALLGGLMADFAERTGKPRWSEKTPQQHPDQIWQLFPSAQIVHIVRDPRHSIASTAAAAWSVEGPLELARRWAEFTLSASAAGFARGPGSYFRLRYEDLVADPESILIVLCAFLREEFDPGMLSRPSARNTAVSAIGMHWQKEVLGPIRPAQDSPAWQALPRHDRARISQIVGSTLPALGYSPAPRRDAYLGRALLGLSVPAEAFRQRYYKARARRRTPEDRYRAVNAHAMQVHGQVRTERELAGELD